MLDQLLLCVACQTQLCGSLVNEEVKYLREEVVFAYPALIYSQIKRGSQATPCKAARSGVGLREETCIEIEHKSGLLSPSDAEGVVHLSRSVKNDKDLG